MRYNALGASGLAVSELALGTMSFGDRTSPAEAARIVASARDNGVNFIDTADVNADGESERVIGRLIRDDRHRWIVATKFGNRLSPGPNRVGQGRKWMIEAVEGSLQRLAIDVIDLYYVDADDGETPVEETVWTIARLIQAGRIRHWGLSNFAGWRLGEIIAACDRLGVPRPISGQPCYNAATRLAEIEYLPACRHFGLGVVCYSPLARGVLTAKYSAGKTPPPGSRAARRDKRLVETELRPESLRVAEQIRALAQRRGITAGQFALAWVLNNSLVAAAVAGPRTFEQWQDYVGALEVRLDADDEAFVDALVAPGMASTPGYNDPRYPIAERLTRP